MHKYYAEKIIFKNNTPSARCRPTGPNRPTAGRSASSRPTAGPAGTRRPLVGRATSRGGGSGLSAWVRPCRPTAGRSASCWPTGCCHLARGWPAAPCGLILPFLPSSSVLLLFLPSPLSTQKCHQFIHLNEQVFRDFGTVNGFNSVRAAKRGLDLLMG